VISLLQKSQRKAARKRLESHLLSMAKPFLLTTPTPPTSPLPSINKLPGRLEAVALCAVLPWLANGFSETLLAGRQGPALAPSPMTMQRVRGRGGRRLPGHGDKLAPQQMCNALLDGSLRQPGSSGDGLITGLNRTRCPALARRPQPKVDEKRTGCAVMTNQVAH
jgi:hypothetical protein